MKRILVLLVIHFIQVSTLFGQNDFTLYKQARKLTIEKKWNKAIQSFNKLRDRYPESRYRDDADFWNAYILEKQGELEDAFFTYQEVIDKHPKSAWVDDAVIHQIFLAETFVRNGKESYAEFLKQKLDDPDVNIRNQAAISLGELGNRAALPVLKNIGRGDDVDLAAMSKKLIEKIEGTPAPVTEEEKSLSDIEILLKSKNEGGLSSEGSDQSFWDKLFYETNRYKTYLQLNRKGEDWSDTELMNFGLWHILDSNQFEDYFSLSADYDREEWLRRFWKRWDPTPTTDANERRDEFLRRVRYARDNFGDEWNGRQFKHLTQQYLREGWSVAPWDSRGELYVKYGDPDHRDTSRGMYEEIWRYYRYDVDFAVKPYITNIFGNGIKPGPMSRIMYRNNQSYIETEYIYKNEFRFDAYKDYSPMKDFEVALDVKKSVSDLKKIDVVYKLSAKDIEFLKDDGKYSAKFLERYVVYNNDFREVLSNQKDIGVLAESGSDKKARRSFRFDFELPKGSYTLALSVTDRNSNKLGIFLEEFRVE
ncbi:MAG: GWxTD domain-containing protein [candidate division KSB1 bacterium]|nr:GWxTD domain-containing protein [candidate division KSB1 bacterium]